MKNRRTKNQHIKEKTLNSLTKISEYATTSVPSSVESEFSKGQGDLKINMTLGCRVGEPGGRDGEDAPKGSVEWKEHDM